MLAEPLAIANRRVFSHVAEELDGFGLQARLAPVVRRNDHFHLYSHHKSAASDQASAFYSFPWNSHDLS
jgi:hypothetical protein